MKSRYLDSPNMGKVLKFSFFPVNASNGWLHLESSGELSRGGAGRGGSICLSVFGKQTKIYNFFYSLNTIKLYGMIVFNWVWQLSKLKSKHLYRSYLNVFDFFTQLNPIELHWTLLAITQYRHKFWKILLSMQCDKLKQSWFNSVIFLRHPRKRQHSAKYAHFPNITL